MMTAKAAIDAVDRSARSLDTEEPLRGNGGCDQCAGDQRPLFGGDYSLTALLVCVAARGAFKIATALVEYCAAP